jgi:hypothetical protein
MQNANRDQYHKIEPWRLNAVQANAPKGKLMRNDAELKHQIRNGCKSDECPLKLSDCWSCEHFEGFSEVIKEDFFYCSSC